MSLLSRLLVRERIPLETQIQQLAGCGIHLRPHLFAETLLQEFPREKFEEKPFIGTVICMSGYADEQPISDNLFHLDAECIGGPGDYARIAERLRDLAQGELPIENIHDHVDFENGDAWVAFDLEGENYEWHARVHDEWIDPEIISKFCGLLARRGGTRRYTYLDLKGRDGILGCATEEELRALRKLTGMKFSWLE